MPNANWSNPTLTSTYTNFVTEVKNRDEDLALQFDGTTSTNLVTNTIRWDSSANRWKKWNGSSWAELTATYALTALSTTGAITGSSTVSGTALIPTAATVPTNGVFLPAANTVGLATGSTERLRVTSTGTALLGTQTALTNAYAIATALTPAVQIEANTGNGAALSITRHASAAANLLLQRGVTGTPVADTEALGQINFNGFDGANYFNAALIRAVVDGTPGTGSMPGRLSFQTTPTGSTTPVERLRLAPAGQILAASLGTAALPVWSFTGDPNTGIYSPGADQLAISTNGTGRLFVDASGRVGIGTGSPGSLLNLAHPTVSDIRLTAAGTLIGNIYGSASDLNVHAVANVPLTFATNNTERARIDSSGRLLVGTSSNRSSRSGTTGFNSLLQIESDTEAGQSITRWAADANSSRFHLQKGRGTGASPAIVAADDNLGDFTFSGYDGVNMTNGARINAAVDGTPGTNDMPGRLVFSTTADGAASPTERLRITSDAYLRMAASTGGIQFNGDTAAANALDDYEEGTFTPTIIGSTLAGAGTYSSQVGRYTKIGNRVCFSIQIAWSAHTGTGNMSIAGLPAAITTQTAAGSQTAAIASTNLATPAGTYLLNLLPANGTTIVLYSMATGGGAITALAIDTAATIYVSGAYEAA